MNSKMTLLFVAATLASCDNFIPAERDASNGGRDAVDASTATPKPARSGSLPTIATDRISGASESAPAALTGEAVVLAEWRKAANHATCAPLALKSDSNARGKPRAATFSGGWAVAFDRSDRRSAYGVAGAGALPDDRLAFEAQAFKLKAQWPYSRTWQSGENLPPGSVAGYGLEGFKDYANGSSGFGKQSLAYLRIPGQTCLYNVWSKLSRDHLELLLDQLEIVGP